MFGQAARQLVGAGPGRGQPTQPGSAGRGAGAAVAGGGENMFDMGTGAERRVGEVEDVVAMPNAAAKMRCRGERWGDVVAMREEGIVVGT